jgi:hypothetical protein
MSQNITGSIPIVGIVAAIALLAISTFQNTQKLDVMEQLWVSLRSSPDYSPPDWHGEYSLAVIPWGRSRDASRFPLHVGKSISIYDLLRGTV